MSDTNKKIEEVLNIDSSKVSEPIQEIIETTKKKIYPKAKRLQEELNPDIEDSEKDFRAIRSNLKQLIHLSKEAIHKIMELAKESDAPRAYEVVSVLIKTSLDTNTKLMELHKNRKDIKKELTAAEASKNSNGLNVNKAVFVGSTSELLDMMKKKEEAEKNPAYPVPTEKENE